MDLVAKRNIINMRAWLFGSVSHSPETLIVSNPLPNVENTDSPTSEIPNFVHSFLELPHETRFSIFDLVEPIYLLKSRQICKWWKHCVTNTSWWERRCKIDKLHFSYDPVPTNWLQYWVLWNRPFQIHEISKTLTTGDHIGYHIPSGCPVRLDSFTSKRQVLVPPPYAYRQEGLQRVISFISEPPLRIVMPLEGNPFPRLKVKTKNDEDILAALLVEYLQTQHFLNKNYWTLRESDGNFTVLYDNNHSLSHIFITKCGQPVFMTAEKLRKEDFRRRGYIGGTGIYMQGEEIDNWVFLENETDLIVPVSFWNKAHEFIVSYFDCPPRERHRDLNNLIPVIQNQSTISAECENFLRDVWKMRNTDPLFTTSLLQHPFLVEHAKSGISKLKQANEEAKYQKLVFGPLSGSGIRENSTKLDSDFIEVDDGNHLSLFENPFEGFLYVPNFLTKGEMDNIILEMDKGTWKSDMESKKVQVYGYNYLNPNQPSEPVPSYLSTLLQKVKDNFSISENFDQLIISDYPPGVGVKPHVDRLFWGPLIFGISLISTCEMTLQSLFKGSSTRKQNLEPGSLYLLSGNTRYFCSHGITSSSVISRRVSLTFRTLATEKVKFPNQYLNLINLSTSSV
eukprot:TRINITY_DN8254_c0_g2_i2.p1 TRINITY_DN8254_c0_g2~~TRINITY_DN8254_c0_g2_i2.p1  ORF type:complete len:623 (+),score=85.31 TRINITY_DN8254_c0_g2_i2:86-1954(+)